MVYCMARGGMIATDGVAVWIVADWLISRAVIGMNCRKGNVYMMRGEAGRLYHCLIWKAVLPGHSARQPDARLEIHLGAHGDSILVPDGFGGNRHIKTGMYVVGD